MAVYIKGMDMPKGTNMMLLITPDGEVYEMGDLLGNDKLIEGAKASHVPTPHGRLGDLDVLYEVVKKRTRNWAGGWGDIECVLTGNDIKNAPTIIPSDPLNEEVNE